MNPQAMKAEIRKARAALTALEELLTGDGSNTTSCNTCADAIPPVVDQAHRCLVFQGVHIALTGAQTKLAALLLSRPGELFSLDEIDAVSRPPSEGWVSHGAIRQQVARLKARLRAADMAELADAIQAGYRSYCWRLSQKSSNVNGAVMASGVHSYQQLNKKG